MSAIFHVSPLDPEYPHRLRSLRDPPASISVRGGPVQAERTVAIVGSRDATADAREFAWELARTLARAGVVIVSGGARGIDAAAHQGALDVDGRTWAVAGTGHRHCFPPAHGPLFESVGRSRGAMIWPFAPGCHHRSGFLVRNRVLVALADAVVVVQAGLSSGAVHAASWARRLDRPLWVVPATPWMSAFAGSCRLLDEGARPLVSSERLLQSFGLSGSSTVWPPASDAPQPVRMTPSLPLPLATDAMVEPSASISPSEFNILQALSTAPLHLDVIAARAGQRAETTSAALLTLALEDVVVEGPPGFFRRRDSHNH